jgi:hypothetical protein
VRYTDLDKLNLFMVLSSSQFLCSPAASKHLAIFKIESKIIKCLRLIV